MPSPITGSRDNAAALRTGILEAEVLCVSDYETLQELAIEEKVDRYARNHLSPSSETRLNDGEEETKLFFTFLAIWGVTAAFACGAAGWITFEEGHLRKLPFLVIAIATTIFATIATILFRRRSKRKEAAQREREISEARRDYADAIKRSPRESEQAVRAYLVGMLDDLEERHVCGNASPLHARLYEVRSYKMRLERALKEASTAISATEDEQVRARYREMAAPITEQLEEVNRGLPLIEAEQQRLKDGIAGYRALIQQRLDPIKFAANNADLIGEAGEALKKAQDACAEAFDAVRFKLIGMERHIVRLAKGDVILTEGCDPAEDFNFRLMLAMGNGAQRGAAAEDPERLRIPDAEESTWTVDEAERSALPS